MDYRLTHPKGEPLPKPQIDVFYTHHRGHLHRINAQETSAEPKSKTIANPTDFMYSHWAPVDDCMIEFEQLNISGPDFGPNVLQFWADTVVASVFRFPKNLLRDYISKKDHVHISTRQAVIHLQEHARPPLRPLVRRQR